MNPDKIIFDLIRAWLEKQIAGCECGGSGIEVVGECYNMSLDDCMNRHGALCGDCPHVPDEEKIPCPTCTPLRELVKELEGNPFVSVKGSHLNKPNFPDLTTATEGSEWLVVSIMKRAGLWEEFESTLYEAHITKTPNIEGPTSLQFKQIIKTISNARYLRDAVKGFLER
jgi:hypothetical protein